MTIWKFLYTLAATWGVFLLMGYAGGVIYTGIFDMTLWEIDVRENILIISLITTAWATLIWWMNEVIK